MSVISNTRFASAVSTGGAVWGVNKVVMNLAKKKLLCNNENMPKSCNIMLEVLLFNAVYWGEYNNIKLIKI